MYSPSISGLHQGIVVRCFLGGLSKVVALGQRTSLKRQSLSHCMTNMAACEFVYKKSFVMYCSCIHQRTLIINITMQWQHHMLFTVYIYMQQTSLQQLLWSCRRPSVGARQTSFVPVFIWTGFAAHSFTYLGAVTNTWAHIIKHMRQFDVRVSNRSLSLLRSVPALYNNNEKLNETLVVIFPPCMQDQGQLHKH